MIRSIILQSPGVSIVGYSVELLKNARNLRQLNDVPSCHIRSIHLRWHVYGHQMKTLGVYNTGSMQEYGLNVGSTQACCLVQIPQLICFDGTGPSVTRMQNGLLVQIARGLELRETRSGGSDRVFPCRTSFDGKIIKEGIVGYCCQVKTTRVRTPKYEQIRDRLGQTD